uniref:Uncharacterized protein n=2 Tax=unclassified bacterial viruses TaxID=12333 RepID=A0AAU8KUD8_9VIRU
MCCERLNHFKNLVRRREAESVSCTRHDDC